MMMLMSEQNYKSCGQLQLCLHVNLQHHIFKFDVCCGRTLCLFVLVFYVCLCKSSFLLLLDQSLSLPTLGLGYIFRVEICN